MTVAELIKALEEHNPESLVVVAGYEGGYDDPHVKTVLIVDDHGAGRPDWWQGRYDSVLFDDDGSAVDAVVVAR